MEHLGWLLLWFLWCLLESFFAAGYFSLMVMMMIIVIFSDKSWLLVSIHFILKNVVPIFFHKLVLKNILIQTFLQWKYTWRDSGDEWHNVWIKFGKNFFKKETPTQVFFCEIYEIFKNTFFTEHLRRLLWLVSGVE